jgi:glutathione S-transferase
MESKPILGYWAIRGLAEPIRLMLITLGVEFEDKLYVQGPAPDYDSSEWFNEKYTLGLSFPNLPYLIDGTLKISESRAIIEYLALKYKPEFTGETLEEKAVVSQLGSITSDLKQNMTMQCYSPNFEAEFENVMNRAKQSLTTIAGFLGTKSFLIGEKVTWPDFVLVEAVRLFDALKPGTINDINTNLLEYANRVESLPNLQDRISKPRLYWTNTIAKWR